MLALFFRVVDVFVPDTAERSDDIASARLVVAGSILLSIMGTFFAVHNGLDPAVSFGSVLAVACGTAVGISIAPVMRLTGRIAPAAFALTTTMFVTILGTTLSGDGIHDLSLWFLLLTPILGSTLVSPATGLLFAAGSICHFVFLYFWTPPQLNWVSADAAKFTVLGGVALTLVLAGLQYARDQSYLALRREASEHIMRLTSARSELEAVTARIDAERAAAVSREREKQSFLELLASRADAEAEALENARAAIFEMAAGFDHLTATVAELEESTALTTQTATSMRTAAGSMAEDAGIVREEVGRVVDAFGNVVKAALDASASVASLNAIASQTREAMQTMAASVAETRRHAGEAADEAVRSDAAAQIGSEAVQETRAGIDRIQKSASIVGDVLEDLERRVVTIGGIVRVIDDVSEQTKLLALNASITATQAGHAGRGFRVVATEMKKLSERTSASTMEIAEIIAGIERGTALAVESMQEGQSSIGETVTLSDKAEAAMERIRTATTTTVSALNAIADRTSTQSAAARDVSAKIGTVSETIDEIVAQLSDHARRASALRSVGDRVGELSQRTWQQGSAQHESGTSLEAAVLGIHKRLKQLSSAHQEQAVGNQMVLKSVEQIQDGQQRQLEASERFQGQSPNQQEV